MLAERDESIKECIFTYKELTADEKARMQSEARDDYYRRLNWAEERGIRKGMEKGMEVHSFKGFTDPLLRTKLQSGRSKSFVIRKVLCEDRNTWHGSLHNSIQIL